MSVFKKTTHVEGVICNRCGTVYDRVTNLMSEYCDDCGAHLWSVDPNTRTYVVDNANATPCVVNTICKKTACPEKRQAL